MRRRQGLFQETAQLLLRDYAENLQCFLAQSKPYHPPRGSWLLRWSLLDDRALSQSTRVPMNSKN